MVYLHEIADARYKAVTGSLGYVSLGIGVVIGILAVVMIISLVPAGVLCNVLRDNMQYRTSHGLRFGTSCIAVCSSASSAQRCRPAAACCVLLLECS
jgi:hypothetical protein